MSWFASISPSVSWMIKAVSEVESSIDRVLDIHASTPVAEATAAMPKDRHATVSPSPLEAISSGDPREGPPKTEEPVHATHLASPDNVFSSTRSGQARSAESAGTLTALGLEEDRSASAPSIKQTMPKEIVEMSRGESQQVPNADSIRLTEGARSAQRANNSSSANCRQNASDTWDGVEIRCGEEGCREDDIARRRDAAINCSSDLESIGGIGESPEATHNRDEHDEVTTNTNIRPAEVEPPPPQELIRLRQVVLQRERQLMTAMTENASLNDSVNLLKVQLESFETLAAEERAIVETLLRETTQKLADKEVQFTEAIKERDHSNSRLISLENSLQLSAVELTKQLQEREEKIRSLTEEVEKLSRVESKLKAELHGLRLQEAEANKELKDFTQKLEASASEIADLKDLLQHYVETEKEQSEMCRELRIVNEQQAIQLNKIQNGLMIREQELFQVKVSLENARHDLSDARRTQAEAAAAATTEALTREISANEELHRKLEGLQRSSGQTEASLRKEISDLRGSLARLEEESNWKEESLHKEVNSLQERLREADIRQQDLYAEARSADRPLVRQIESLQNQHAVARKDWEEIEANLIQQLRDAENDRNRSTENERLLSAKLGLINNRLSVLELQLSRERDVNSRLLAQLESERTKSENQERLLNDAMAKLVLLKSSHASALIEAKESFERMLTESIQKERKLWAEELRDERIRILKESERTKQRLESRSDGNQAFPPHQRGKSTDSLSQPANLHRFQYGPQKSGGWLADSTTDLMLDPPNVTTRQLQEQLTALQTELNLAKQTRDELAEELLKVAAESSNTEKHEEKINALKEEYGNLHSRHLTCLELLGEKTEQVEDLKQTINEMRALFHNDLLLKLST